jgi:hypothetical protein
VDSDEPASDQKDDVRPKSKQGARNLVSGPYLSVALSLLHKQLVQLDRLAVEIRAGSGTWITRSGIIAAMIEASLLSEAFSDVAGALYKQSLRGRSLKRNHSRHGETLSEGTKRLIQTAKYLLRKRKRHL